MLTGAAVLLALIFFAVPPALAADPQCGLLQDCTMDNFYGNEGAGSGAWKIFGEASGIGLHPTEGWPRGPSVWLRGNHQPFDAGIYQQVAVTPGTGYIFELAWAVEMLDGRGYQDGYEVNRRLGIDPFGGTDPNSSNVRWSPDYFGSGKFELVFAEYARAPVMTVFIRVNNPYPDKVVDVYLDTASLKPDGNMPPIQVAVAPTAPPPPTQAPQPTAAPTRPPRPTAVPEPTDPPEPTDEPTVKPTVEPTEPPVEDTATPRPRQTRVSQPTATRVANVAPSRPTRVRTAPSDSPSAQQAGVSLSALNLGLVGLLGCGAIGGAFLLVGFAFVVWRRAR